MPELKVFALKKLNMIVDEFWPEISEAIEKMYVKVNIYIYSYTMIIYNIFIKLCFICYVRFVTKGLFSY